MAARSFSIHDTYIHLPHANGSAAELEGGESFWAQSGEELDKQFSDCRIVSAFRFEGDWPSWEMHPAGDEVVYLLSGKADMILELPEGETTLRLDADNPCVIVPQGIWHTAKALEPSETMHITPGEGTQHRAV